MVTRVALAIKAELGRQMDAVPLADSQPGDWYSARGAEVQLEQVVRVALAAMREPTEAMCDVGKHVNSEWLNEEAPLGEGMYRDPAIAVFKAMIDAALK